MTLVEQHTIGEKHPLHGECHRLCFLSKNLYNVALYNWRQIYIANHKLPLEQWKPLPRYLDAYRELRPQVDYQSLPDKVAKQTLKLWANTISAYWGALKAYTKDPTGFTGAPKLPRYKDPKSGQQVVCYERGAISKKSHKHHRIRLSKSQIEFHTKVRDWDSLKQVRIVPRGAHFVIEVVYEGKTIESPVKRSLVAGLDLGLNNLVAVGTSDGDGAFIINGRPLKGINQWWNKEVARLKSELPLGQWNSRRIKRITDKRNAKVKDYMHKVSRCVVNRLVSAGVETLIVGKNIHMKQDINIGSRNNQNFVQVPHMRLVQMIAYKFQMHQGRRVVEGEESYTSKCSFLDSEPIRKHDAYAGKRVKRGLFRASDGTLINADLNAAYNIMAKHWPKAFRKPLGERIEGDWRTDVRFAVHPVRLSMG